MSEHTKHVEFSGRLLLLGFGSIGRGVLPLLLRHINIHPDQITILKATAKDVAVAEGYGVHVAVQPLTHDNFERELDARLHPGDFLLNLAINVSSLALIDYCQRKDVLYLDACIEPWAGGHFDTSVSPAQRSNYAFREAALQLRERSDKGPTAVLMHGANPGLVSHFVKRALLNIAADTGHQGPAPSTRAAWASLACTLGVKVIHVAERDNQVGNLHKRQDEFVNTWSCEAFVDECCQPAELGWGIHERHWLPAARRFDFGSDCAIYLDRPGASVRVRSWTPREGPYHGFLVSHGEAMSIAAYLSNYDDNGQLLYRPTVHYAYYPCDDAVLSLHELAGKNWQMQSQGRLLMEDIVAGMDELGVLLMGHDKNAYWYGSQLSTDEARRLAPHNSATTLQVTAGVMAGVIWALRHSAQGIVEPDEMDHEEVLSLAAPYLGPMVGMYSEWTPLQGRGRLYAEEMDQTDPWQFLNFYVQ